MLLVVSGVQAWRRFLILVFVGATIWLVICIMQAWHFFFNFGTCRSNDNLQMRRVRVAVISIGPMVSCE